MPIDFPNSPTVGSTFTSGSTVWAWDGAKWTAITTLSAGSRPAFSATQSTTQTVFNTSVKITIDTIQFDVTSAFSTVNNRFQPLIAGYYQINGRIGFNPSSANIAAFAAIYKNGAEYRRGDMVSIAGIQIYVSQVAALVYLNGSTDYVELWGYEGVSGPTFGATLPGSSFDGVLVSGGVGAGPATGPAIGTPPTIVQSLFSTADNSSGLTLGAAPANGNLLVAITSNAGNCTAQSGWTRQFQGTSGTDFTGVLTKLCGAGESATQTPIATVSGASAIGMWELHGQNAAPLVFAVGNPGGLAGLLASSCPAFPALTNVICLQGCVIPSNTITILSNLNVGVSDSIINSGNRRAAFGHTLNDHPLFQQANQFSASTDSKYCAIGITS